MLRKSPVALDPVDFEGVPDCFFLESEPEAPVRARSRLGKSPLLALRAGIVQVATIYNSPIPDFPANRT